MLRRMPEPRELIDPKALRAVAHPVRVRLMEELIEGPATATELSDRIGESPANCSWHLRQLAKYGFVEETGGGTGRQRPWQLVIQEKHISQSEIGDDLRLATTSVMRMLAAREYESLRAWFTTMHGESAQWRDSAFVTQNVGWCTAEELSQLGAAVSELCAQFVHRINDPAARPADARPVRLLAWGTPAQPLPFPTESESRES